VNKLTAELETVRSNWRTEGSLTRGKMIELHHAKLRAEEALYEARSNAKAAGLKAQQREDALRADVQSLRDSLDAVTRERSRQEQDWLSQAGAFRREVEKLREQASELDSEIQTVEAGRQAALSRAESSEEQARAYESSIQSLRQDVARLEVEKSDTKHTAEKQLAGMRTDAEIANSSHVSSFTAPPSPSPSSAKHTLHPRLPLYSAKRRSASLPWCLMASAR
jgi:chromosome segregation ATPase